MAYLRDKTVPVRTAAVMSAMSTGRHERRWRPAATATQIKAGTMNTGLPSQVSQLAAACSGAMRSAARPCSMM